MHVDRRLLGWGLFFILLGGIPLAAKAGLLDEASLRQWPMLWPILLIGWGLGLLLRGTELAVIGGAVTAITFGVMGGSALAAGFGGVGASCSANEATKPFETRSGAFGDVAIVDVAFNCGSLTVGAQDGSGWSIKGGDRNGVGPDISSSPGSLRLEDRANAGNPFDNDRGRATWDVTLPRSTALALGLTLNAGEATVEMGGATLSTVSVVANAASLAMRLGEAVRVGNVDASVNVGSVTILLPGGAREVYASLNAGSMTICVPSGTAVRAEWAGAVGSNNFDDLGLVKVDDDTYTTAGFVEGQPHVELDVSANAGSFTLQIGGACNA